MAPLRARQTSFRPEQTGLLLARAYAAAGMQDEAGALFDAIAQRYGSFDARTELFIWAAANGRTELAQRELKELTHARKHMAKHTRTLHAELFKRIDTASATSRL